jgi:hypothetical protein
MFYTQSKNHVLVPPLIDKRNLATKLTSGGKGKPNTFSQRVKPAPSSEKIQRKDKSKISFLKKTGLIAAIRSDRHS